jgi:hypothetical protein
MIRAMGRKRKEPAPTAFAHDHFDGSAHCIECGGDCKLSGCELAFTCAVRYVLESEVYRPGYYVSTMLEFLLLGSLGKERLGGLRARAKATAGQR